MIEDIVKKQHYIPRFYLRRFSDTQGHANYSNDKKNKIIVYDKKNKYQYSSNVQDIACQKYFYDIKDSTNIDEKQLFEHTFSKLEDEFSIEINMLIKRCEQDENYFTVLITSREEKEKLAFYIALQLFRTKKVRRKIEETFKVFNNDRLKFFNAYLRHFPNGKAHKDLKLIVDEQKIHLNLLADDENLNSYADFFVDSNWCFLRNVTNIPFIISDNPVCKVPIYDEETYINLSYFTDKLYIYFPLSPNIALFIFRKDIPNYKEWEKNINRLIPISNIDTIDFINKYQWLTADEKIFINPKYSYLIKRYS